MSDLVLFAFGFVLFAFTTSATMWFGYRQFNAVYRRDMATDPQAPVLMKDENNNEFRVPADQTHVRDLDIVDEDEAGTHLTA